MRELMVDCVERSRVGRISPYAPHVQYGRAGKALRRYEEIFDGAFAVDELDTYDESAAGPTGQVQPAVCTLLGQRITCIDSPVQHVFDMTTADSLFVECGDEEELQRLFVALAEDGEVAMPLDDYGFSRGTDGLRTTSESPWQLNLR